jgi:toxin ParE1/3/4
MKVVFTPAARADLDNILSYIASNYPGAVGAFERRLKLVLRCIEMWPNNATTISDRRGVRQLPLVRYPYKIFYRVTHVVEILHVHHAAREPWGEERP